MCQESVVWRKVYLCYLALHGICGFTWPLMTWYINNMKISEYLDYTVLRLAWPAIISFRSSAFHALHHSTEQHDLLTCYPSPSLCWRQPAVCLLLHQGTLLGHWIVCHWFRKDLWLYCQTFPIKITWSKHEKLYYYCIIGQWYQQEVVPKAGVEAESRSIDEDSESQHFGRTNGCTFSLWRYA